MYSRVVSISLPGSETLMFFHIFNNPLFLLKLSMLLDIEMLNGWTMVFPQNFIDSVSLGIAIHFAVLKDEG